MKTFTTTARSRSRLRCAGVIAIALGLLVPAGDVRADRDDDRIDRLAETLSSSKHHKARIGAAVSLGRLEDKRALQPLVEALGDDHRVVRAVAAAALGRLGDPRALPSLKRASKDSDELVRKRALEAIAEIRNGADRARMGSTRSRRAGFGDEPRRVRATPELYVSVQSASDDTGSATSKKVRQKRARDLKLLMIKELAGTPQVTMSASAGQRHGLDQRNVDLSITRFTQRIRGPYVEIECQIRIALSNDRGKMLSFLTGGAKVQVPKRTFKRQYLDHLRREALENAVKGVHQDLIRHLRRHNPS